MIQNNPDAIKCLACETLKPGAKISEVNVYQIFHNYYLLYIITKTRLPYIFNTFLCIIKINDD